MTRQDPATIVAAADPHADPAWRSVAPPLWPSDSYEWTDAENKPDYDYSRTVSPNRDMLIDALAKLEGAAGGAATGSGQSAAMLALSLLPVAGRSCRWKCSSSLSTRWRSGTCRSSSG